MTSRGGDWMTFYQLLTHRQSCNLGNAVFMVKIATIALRKLVK